jgi:predicted unusual protein kinase regulating ubiquinone biosynthesis (AarF/ABC1/UbiB family)
LRVNALFQQRAAELPPGVAGLLPPAQTAIPTTPAEPVAGRDDLQAPLAHAPASPPRYWLAPVGATSHEAPPGPGRPPRFAKMRRWFRRRPAEADPERERVLRALPRRRSLLGEHSLESAPSMRRSVSFPIRRFGAARRVAVWLWSLGLLLFAAFRDRTFLPEVWRGQSRRRRAAVRLRRALERMGGTAIKIGQQAAMRLDILSYEYCDELSKMLDKVPAFPAAEAITAIEVAMGRPLYEVFEAFDPNPIGSASVSCVYQARRKDGRAVAVKVRRPGIGMLFMADCRALELILGALEALSLLRPGLSKNLIVEFRNMLLGELDFVREARNAEIFRRRTRKSGMHFVTAPKVHFDCSNEAVLVTDFVNGIWLSEVLSAVERKDPELLALFERLNIVPKRVAQRLMEVNFFTTAESILFHADPHPANIVVLPDSKLVFIDFGACGAYTEKERVSWRRLFDAQAREDVGEMVQCAIAILEPLPPLDVEEFARKLELVFWQDLYSFRSKHSEWWERTSAHIWLSFLTLTSEYEIPMNLNTLQMIRSTLLYDTIAARLYSKIDAYERYQRYLNKAGTRAHQRVQRRVERTLFEGPPPPFWLRLEQFTRMAEKAIYVVQRTLDDPPYKLAAQFAKTVYAVQVTVTAIVYIAVSGVALIALRLVRGALSGKGEEVAGVGFVGMLRELGDSRLFWVIVGLAIVINFRKLNFRLLDKDPRPARQR